MVLERIQKENDIKKLNGQELSVLADEIRTFLIEKISVTGGHLASNLGVVELTMAMHLAFDLPQDRMIWDVGHQAYTHKLLTGRKAGFDDLRREKKVIAMLLTQVTVPHLYLRGLDMWRQGKSWGRNTM